MQMFRQGGPREHGPAVHPLKKKQKTKNAHVQLRWLSN